MSEIHEVTQEEEARILAELRACNTDLEIANYVEKEIGKDNFTKVCNIMLSFATGDKKYDFDVFHKNIRFAELIDRYADWANGDTALCSKVAKVIMYLGIICQVKRTGSVML